MQLTGRAFLRSVVESRWKPARQRILGVRWRLFFTPKVLNSEAQGCSLERTTLGLDATGIVYAEGVTQPRMQVPRFCVTLSA
jgi:hypothetical protein